MWGENGKVPNGKKREEMRVWLGLYGRMEGCVCVCDCRGILVMRVNEGSNYILMCHGVLK